MALTDKLSAIGDAIREKTGKTDLMTLDAMPAEIASITTGGGGDSGIPEEAFVLTGNCTYKFAYGGWDWFINQYGNQITTTEITGAGNMFYNSKVKQIPFEINFNVTTASHTVNDMFAGAQFLKTAPQINNMRPGTLDSFFNNCYYLREFPENYGADWDWGYMTTATSAYTGAVDSMFGSCHSLRKLPMELLKHHNPKINYSSSMYYMGFSVCASLDEIVDLPIPYTQATWTSNAFYQSSFANCNRLKNLTFAKNEDGTPIVVSWKNQTITLTDCVGYALTSTYITSYNSGITAQTEITDDATYQELKNHPDSWTTKRSYSRYNHDSAVATINSLPDTSAYLASAGGTNTIKFKGDAGSATDGGAINTLTAEEIAVATAKGWTVTLS